MSEYYTVKEIAERYGKCEKTITRWIAKGIISAQKEVGSRSWVVKLGDNAVQKDISKD